MKSINCREPKNVRRKICLRPENVDKSVVFVPSNRKQYIIISIILFAIIGLISAGFYLKDVFGKNTSICSGFQSVPLLFSDGRDLCDTVESCANKITLCDDERVTECFKDIVCGDTGCRAMLNSCILT